MLKPWLPEDFPSNPVNSACRLTGAPLQLPLSPQYHPHFGRPARYETCQCVLESPGFSKPRKLMIYKICQNISHLRVWSCIISYFSTNNDRIHVCCARKFLSYSHGRQMCFEQSNLKTKTVKPKIIALHVTCMWTKLIACLAAFELARSLDCRYDQQS